jgi:hypothetical protein
VLFYFLTKTAEPISLAVLRAVPMNTNDGGFADSPGYDTNGDGQVETVFPIGSELP